MAFSGIAAIIGGSEITAAVVLSAVAEVGMVTTVVGAVTGNKDLMKIGGAMSLVGGVGGLINGLADTGIGAAAGAGLDDAGLAGTQGIGEGWAENGVANAAETSAVATPTAEVTSGLSDTAGGAGGIGAQSAGIPSSTPVPTDASGNALGSGMYGNTPAVDQIGSQTGMPQTPGQIGANAPADVTGANAPTGPVDVSGPAAPSTPYNAGADSQAAYSNMPGGGLEQSAMKPQSFWEKMQSWFKENPKLGDNMIKVGSNVLSGIQQQGIADRDYELKNNYYNNQNAYVQNAGKWALPSTGILGQAKAKG